MATSYNAYDDPLKQPVKKFKFTPFKIPELKKCFYTEHPNVTARSDVRLAFCENIPTLLIIKILYLKEEIEAYRREHQIRVKGNGAMKPIFTFEEANIPGNYYLFSFKFLFRMNWLHHQMKR